MAAKHLALHGDHGARVDGRAGRLVGSEPVLNVTYRGQCRRSRGEMVLALGAKHATLIQRRRLDRDLERGDRRAMHSLVCT
ncbi:MAG TPA: hypothetical protein VMJ10_30090 [Kofleriaceae bacterium]|nr:hypothetical protein [Kofleriaceae bacterium]